MRETTGYVGCFKAHRNENKTDLYQLCLLIMPQKMILILFRQNCKTCSKYVSEIIITSFILHKSWFPLVWISTPTTSVIFWIIVDQYITITSKIAVYSLKISTFYMEANYELNKTHWAVEFVCITPYLRQNSYDKKGILKYMT